MQIEETVTKGWKTCGRDRRSAGDCPGYESTEIDLIVETRHVTFGDNGAPTSDPYYPIESHSIEHLRPVDPADLFCEHCGNGANLSLAPRIDFPRLSEHSPNEIVRRAALEREREQRAAESLSAEERSARALEALAAAGGLGRDGELAEVRAALAEVRALLTAGNGHDDHVIVRDADDVPDPAPEDRPRPRRKAEP